MTNIEKIVFVVLSIVLCLLIVFMGLMMAFLCLTLIEEIVQQWGIL